MRVKVTYPYAVRSWTDSRASLMRGVCTAASCIVLFFV